MRAFFLIPTALAVYGDDLPDVLKKSNLSGYAKTMFVYDDRVLPKLDQSTFGIGGKLSLVSGDLNGFKAKAAYYVTDDLGLAHSNPRRTDAYMFDVDKTPYSVLGEGSLEYTNGSSSFLFGRQEIDTPIVSTYDYRIIPNLFEAYTYTNTAYPHTALTLSYITKMSGLDGLVSFKHFRSMSQQTYTSLAMTDSQTVDSNDGDTLDISKVSGDQGVLMRADSFMITAYVCRDGTITVVMSSTNFISISLIRIRSLPNGAPLLRFKVTVSGISESLKIFFMVSD